MGESIMNQTGWYVTILAGGPSPNNSGNIMTYLSHTGKTKQGETFEKLLGVQQYDEHLLIPFEKFLQASFSPEDCAARSLAKGEISEESDNECDEEEKGKEMRNSEAEDKGKKNERESGYEQMKKKNIQELQTIVAKLKEQYTAPVEPNQKQVVNKPTLKKDKKGEVPTVRRELQRNKDKQDANSSTSTTTLTAETPLETSDGPDTLSQAVNVSVSPPTALSVLADAALNDSARMLTLLSPSTQTTPKAKLSVASILQGAINDFPLTVTPTAASATADNSDINTTPLKHVQFTNNSASINATPPPVQTDQPMSLDAPISHEHTPLTRPASVEEEIEVDVAMKNAASSPSPSRKTPNDEDLPTWLAPMIGYLRAVARDGRWQDLVTEFVDFEKHGPQNGYLPTKSQPQAISDWIKSKKNNVVPAIQVDSYGKQFMAWWKAIQPAWRVDDDGLLVCVAREGVGLSWWLKSAAGDSDTNVWIAVEDVSWVIQQMKDSAAPPTSVPAK